MKIRETSTAWVWLLIALWASAPVGTAVGTESDGVPAASPEPPRVTAEGFAVPQPGQRFVLPRDHGSHPEFKIEWWYVTGHLWDGASNRFGFQSTFFRSAGPRAGASRTNTTSRAFGSDQLMLAHMALLEVGPERFLHQERLNREGWAAGAEAHDLRVWNGGGSLERVAGKGDATNGVWRLRGGIRAEAQWDLQLTPAKPLVVFGVDGVSRKGEAPTAASHYLTFPRLQVEGTLEVAGAKRAVRGLAWMDHEYSSSQLATNQVGWDWMSIQLHDGREIMAYRMRRADGTSDPFSTLAWVDHDGRVQHEPLTDVRLEPRSPWRSPRTGAEYPSGWNVRTRDPETRRERVLQVEPLARDQELGGEIGEVPYWEGACRVRDEEGREIGSAYVELTGYAGDLAGRLR